MKFPSRSPDRRQLPIRRIHRHHGDEVKAQELGKVRKGDRGRAARRLDEGSPGSDRAGADRVHEQRARQSVLEAAARLV
jgi:hypothetical protein